MESVKLKHVAKIVTEKSDLPHEVLSLDKLESFTGRILEKENDFSGDSFLGRKGDVVFAKIRPYLAKVAHLEKDMNVFTTLMLMRPVDADGKFVFWCLINQPFIDEANSLSGGVTMPTIGWEQLKNLEIPLPDLATQQRIAAFLDARTTKIDALSSELTAFKANLLLQKRSLVSECVTKGIPSERDRAYKDSGVEWLGEIPAGWEANKGIRLFSAKKGPRAGLLSNEWCGSHEGEYPVYSGKTEDEGVMAKIDSYDFDYGDDGVLFSTTVGAKAMTVMHLKNKFSLSQNCLILNPITESNIRYYYYLLQPAFDYAKSFIPSHMQPSFRIADFYQYQLPIPPLDEQQRIADYLDVECARIDALIGEIDNQVNLLKTYRKSLINEVVTGKVEV
jgi:type I restriction enzyme, S subunit